MPTPGYYQLLLRLAADRRIQVGKLGRFDFPAGYYVYTGSARGGLEGRLARHQRRQKRFHWHIDYLLRYAKIVRIRTFPEGKETECKLNARLFRRPGAQCVADGFGSSDCRCRTHLAFFRREDDLSFFAANDSFSPSGQREQRRTVAQSQ